MAKTREQWTQELISRLGGTPRPVPLRNVIERVAAVLHGAELVFVDNALSADADAEGGGVSGRITVITDAFVALIDVVGVSSASGPGPDTGKGSASVVVVGRSALTRVDVRPDPRAAYVNSGQAWSANGAADGWPHGGRVELSYEGLEGTVVLPTEDADGFSTVVASLMWDLAR